MKFFWNFIIGILHFEIEVIEDCSNKNSRDARGYKSHKNIRLKSNGKESEIQLKTGTAICMISGKNNSYVRKLSNFF